MDKREAIEMLHAGKVEEWNEHREGGGAIPDLNSVHLSGVNLSGVNLSSVNLKHAKLVATNLDGANLKDASLEGANLEYAKLRGANLEGASLVVANLALAMLDDAVLAKARLALTILTSSLAKIKGLDEVIHEGPSQISHHSLRFLPEPFPEAFLRGCGVSDLFIEAARAEQGAFVFYNSFISYSHANKAFVTRLHGALQGKGLRCWRDEHDLLVGAPMRSAINEAIRMRDRVILVCSKESLASKWVNTELQITFDEEERRGGQTIILPIVIDDYLFREYTGQYAAVLRDRLGADFRDCEETKAFDERVEQVVWALRKGDSAVAAT